MKRIIFIMALFIATAAQSQDAIKKVIVETYYVSDDNDATDTTGGILESGSKTYRIYIQMKPGCKLTKIYGDNNHTLKIASTANFFNNIDRGKTFGKDISKSNYNNNTVALDTWLTIGETTKSSAITYFGILKSQDNNGSFIGGVNNDGGSAGITNGLLTNNDSLAGIPLTIADGMDTMTNIPSNWSNNGFIDLISGVDSTIFGSVKIGNEFISNNAYLQNSGVTGVIPDSNQVLVAQLTTKGDISFELNVEIIEIDGTVSKYVAKKSLDSLSANLSDWLKFPFECGCKDPNYFEYNPDLTCSDQSKCQTYIVLGCMDPNACNYNSNANYNIQSLCCYPGMCADRDISLVCPSLAKKDLKENLNPNIYPNPAQSQITIQITLKDYEETKYAIYNSLGKIEIEKNLGVISGENIEELNISKLKQGIYLVRLFTGNTVSSRTFIKL